MTALMFIRMLGNIVEVRRQGVGHPLLAGCIILLIGHRPEVAAGVEDRRDPGQGTGEPAEARSAVISLKTFLACGAGQGLKIPVSTQSALMSDHQSMASPFRTYS